MSGARSTETESLVHCWKREMTYEALQRWQHREGAYRSCLGRIVKKRGWSTISGKGQGENGRGNVMQTGGTLWTYGGCGCTQLRTPTAEILSTSFGVR